MFRIKLNFTVVLLFLFTCLLPLHVYGQDHQKQKAMNNKDASGATEIKKAADYPLMPEPGKKVQLGDGYYLIYKFDKKPKMGMVIIKVEVFNGQDKKDTSLEIMGDSGMPSMSGAHDTGDKPFTLSNKGDYLLPINIVMPGDWEIRLTVKKAGKIIFRGKHQFDV